MAFPGGSNEMKLLTKAHMSQRRLIEIFRVIESGAFPSGESDLGNPLQ